MSDHAAESTAPAPGASLEAGAWKEVTLLVLGATADHAVHCGDAEVEPFRQLVRDSVEGLKNPASSSQVLIAAGVLSQAIAHYAKQTQRAVDTLLTDTGSTIQVFLSHLERLHPDRDALGLVAELRRTLESALRAGNVGAQREALTEVLEKLSQQADERRRQSLELTGRLQDRITVLEQSLGARPPAVEGTPGPVDLCTGLPIRSEAEVALRRAVESDSKAYAAIFYLHRMVLTNARFGEAIGNQVILFCSQHIATTVTRGNDQLFRWAGAAFVAILERQESTLNVSSEVQRIVSAPLSRFFETASRSVYLPIKITATAVPLFDTNYAEVSAGIEQFILQASGPVHSD